ncbi:MAG: histidine phosphatase family protein [Deltaproteobacteria bacterium]|jgi:alpha-ribazole phosphatase|nr:histidine phosphatase family protein [Deltaproteobacteria bacterium]
MKILNSYEPCSKRFQADLSSLYSNNDSLVYLLRHGRIEGHGTKRFIGQTDVLLDDLGKSQATAWHKALASIHFNAVYSSSLKRCYKTAQLVCPKQNIDIDNRLNEINMGNWDGKTFDEIKKKRLEEFEKRGSQIYQFRPANGESFKDLSDRIFPFFNSLETADLNQEITHGQEDPCSNILVITHAGVIRTIICHILEMNPEDLFKIKLAYGELFVLKI